MVSGIGSQKLLRLGVETTSAPDVSVQADASRRADARFEAAPLIEVVLADDELGRASLASDRSGAGHSGGGESESYVGLHGCCNCANNKA